MHRRLPGWLAAGLACTALGACVSNATVVDRATTAEQAAEKAIVIVSVSHDRTATGASARFIIDGGTPQAVKVESAAGKMELPIKNHFHDKYGHVYVVELPPGRHRITSWNASWHDRNTTPVTGVPLEFDVARGQVVCIGNLHVKWLLGKMLFFNKQIPYAAMATIDDQSAIDIPIAEKLNPAVAGRARIALLPQGPWGKAPPVPDMASPGDTESSGEAAGSRR
ncbi:MAG: hypothetical protein ACJ8IK_14500 [Burkholderiaceae bacterium]